MTPLPVDAVVPDVVAASAGCVLVAPPGSGKTTRVPPGLVRAVEGRVLLLQPRRVAARLAARRIAWEQGWTIGDEIGWRVRFEDTTGPRTRLEVLTEGLLTRRLQDDPFLEGVGCVVLDEFHERSLHADLALAMLRDAGHRVVVMSATLEAEPVARFLDVPVIRAEGRSYPVEVGYSSDELAATVRRERGRAGHTLVFLPGVRAISDLAWELRDLDPLPLHGRLSPEEQDHALAPSETPKIVLSTNVAETSVTLEGVEVVVDSGLAKVPRFDAPTGVERLELLRISEASADQRAGRAGRTGPGRCVRVWSAKERLRPAESPEIARVDIAGAVVQIRAWGADPLAFPWFERPPEGPLRGAVALVDELGDAELLARFPLHPRAAAVLVAAHDAGCPDALDVLADLSLPAERRRVRSQLRRLGERHLGRWRVGAADVGEVLRAGYPDRVARRREGRRYLMADGQGVELDGDGPTWLVALELSGRRGREHLVRRWVEIDEVPLSREVETDWWNGRVRHGVVERYGAIVVSRGPVNAPPPRSRVRELVLEHTSERDLAWPDELVARVELARSADPSLPRLDRRVAFEQAAWHVKTVAELRAWDRHLERWTHTEKQRLERLCPERIQVPSGSRLKVRYEADGPVLAARVQQLFGWEQAPRVAGRALRVELLSPANRPVQVTDDLAGFWSGSYAEVRKEMRGRYPKHAWPEDPRAAVAEDRPRRRR